ncbi:MAG: hypothetical protein RL653_2827 [Pseudomonadota bacterium]|jgi:hypothetical protein
MPAAGGVARKNKTQFDNSPAPAGFAPAPAPAPHAAAPQADGWGNIGNFARPVFNPSDPFGFGSPPSPAPAYAPPQFPQAQDARSGGSKTLFQPSGSHPAAAQGPRVRAALIEFRGSGDPGRIHAVREGRNILGRDPDCGVRLEDGRASGKHGYLMLRENDALFTDISTNGTIVDGRILQGDQAPLTHGTRLEIGGSVLVFLFLPASALPR